MGSCDDNSKPVLSTGSEPVDDRPPTKEDKQESAGTSKSLRSNQAHGEKC